MLKKLAIFMIVKYQESGGSLRHFNLECNYTPSCSEYTKQAIIKYGLLLGVCMGIKRIRSCNDPNLLDKKLDPLQ